MAGDLADLNDYLDLMIETDLLLERIAAAGFSKYAHFLMTRMTR